MSAARGVAQRLHPILMPWGHRRCSDADKLKSPESNSNPWNQPVKHSGWDVKPSQSHLDAKMLDEQAFKSFVPFWVNNVFAAERGEEVEKMEVESAAWHWGADKQLAAWSQVTDSGWGCLEDKVTHRGTRGQEGHFDTWPKSDAAGVEGGGDVKALVRWYACCKNVKPEQQQRMYDFLGVCLPLFFLLFFHC